jgi:hypothetical protein
LNRLAIRLPLPHHEIFGPDAQRVGYYRRSVTIDGWTGT